MYEYFYRLFLCAYCDMKYPPFFVSILRMNPQKIIIIKQ